MMLEQFYAWEQEIDPIEVGEWVTVRYPRREFQMTPSGFTGQIVEIVEPYQATNPFYRSKSTMVKVRPKNPTMNEEDIPVQEVPLLNIMVNRNRDGSKDRP